MSDAEFVRDQASYDYMAESIRRVKQERHFYPFSTRELFEAQRIMSMIPRLGGGQQVYEIAARQDAFNYPKGGAATGYKLVQEYAFYYRRAGTLFEAVKRTKNIGAFGAKVVGTSPTEGIRTVVHFADMAAIHRGEEREVHPLERDYFIDDANEYVSRRLGEMGVRDLVRFIGETHHSLVEREDFWANSLEQIRMVNGLQSAVDRIFEITPRQFRVVE